MPYYIYAIHKNEHSNRLLNKFDNFEDAREEEKNMQAARGGDRDYFARLIRAENDKEAEERADLLRIYLDK